MEVRRTPVLVVLLLTVSLSAAQNNGDLKLCLNESNYQYCNEMSQYHIECVLGRDNIDCMRLIQDGKADIVKLEPPEIYTAGSYFDLEVIATNLVTESNLGYRFQTVAVVKSGSGINTLKDLKGKKACFSSVGEAEGWNIPVGIILNEVNDVECKKGNDLTSIGSFFQSSCAAGSWSFDDEVDEKLKTENKNLCSLCKSPDACNNKDEFAGIFGSLRCLQNGDIAFTTVERMKNFTHFESSNFNFLCLNDTTIPVNLDNPCVWAEMPTAGYLTRKGNDVSSKLKNVIDKVNELTNRPPWLKYILGDFKKLSVVSEERKDWKNYLGNYIKAINRTLNCEKKAKFCTKSDEEEKKCNSFSMASYGRYLKPVIECIKENSSNDCLSSIKKQKADLITLSGRDVYTAGKYEDMVPIASEEYSEKNNISYYAVAVIKADSDIKSLQDLKGKKSCHTGIGRNAGWIIPISEFMKLDLINKKQCDVSAAVADFFSESCVPGAKDKEYNPKLSGVDKLCKLCKDPEKCSNEDEYSGYEGAFRCLVEGGGDVAFVKNSTVPGLVDGNSQLPWAKDLKSSDYKLLCPDGSKVDISHYLNCNLAAVPSHRFVVTSNKMDQSDRLNVVYMLTTAGELFNQSSPIFHLFGSYDESNDLLFKNSAINLKSVKFDSKYDEVLDKDYLEALKMTDPKKCNSATTAVAAFSVVICSALLSFFM
ncbi:transferrin-like [Centruroides vittatus]|uniref:transferrin-like n=1 Tax=Centruroides vittatus TaxID=120091 RepID=UPI00350F7DFB